MDNYHKYWNKDARCSNPSLSPQLCIHFVEDVLPNISNLSCNPCQEWDLSFHSHWRVHSVLQQLGMPHLEDVWMILSIFPKTKKQPGLGVSLPEARLHSHLQEWSLSV